MRKRRNHGPIVDYQTNRKEKGSRTRIETTNTPTLSTLLCHQLASSPSFLVANEWMNGVFSGCGSRKGRIERDIIYGI